MTQATALHAAAAPLPNVLVVDDDQATRELLATVLSRSGCRVTCAEELEEAAAILEYRDYDALCVDLDLRGLSGLEGLELVGQAHHRWPQLNIVVQTGNGDPEVHRACFRFGARSVFVKGRPIVEFLHLIQPQKEEVASC
ncbi:MAG: response regulator [Thermoanaerobaculia bacterium]|jgi:CheY-like chemotaxis protein|nr:response regulator [Thermoanaerobaculia bacterium]MBP9823999.1 response regulator [Thermoanaerobaculia bacterium]